MIWLFSGEPAFLTLLEDSLYILLRKIMTLNTVYCRKLAVALLPWLLAQHDVCLTPVPA